MSRVTITGERDTFRFLDQHGDLWRLTPTGDPHMPLTITLIGRKAIDAEPPNLMEALKRSLEPPAKK